MKSKRPNVLHSHFNLWMTIAVAVCCHFWIAWAFLSPFPKGDLISSSPLFEIIPPEVWAAFSIATGLGMLYGLVIGPFHIQQFSAAWGCFMAAALALNGLVETIRLYAEGVTPPVAVRLLFGLGLFYTIGHFAFSTEAPSNPAMQPGWDAERYAQYERSRK